MVDANALMRGNFLYSPDGLLVKVLSIIRYTLTLEYEDGTNNIFQPRWPAYSLISYIPLEIKDIGRIYFDDFQFEYDPTVPGYYIYYQKKFIRGIEYIHEVQNLVYCITGEKLTLEDLKPLFKQKLTIKF